MKKQGALFDLDGVLIDTEPLYTEFWAQIGRKFGLPSPTFAHDIKGTTLDDILSTHFADARARQQITDEVHRFEESVVYRLFPGALGFVAELRQRGYSTAIVTSSDGVKMGYLFGRHPELRPLFDVVVDGSMVQHSKPHPEGYSLAAQLLGCAIEDCLVFEDSLQGLEAGRRSGATVVGLATTNPRNAIAGKADAVIDGFDGLACDALLARLAPRG